MSISSVHHCNEEVLRLFIFIMTVVQILMLPGIRMILKCVFYYRSSNAQGLADSARLQFLRRVAEDVKFLLQVIHDIDTLKKRMLLQSLFLEEMVKSAQGLADSARLQFLRRVAEDVKFLPQVIQDIDTLKKRMLLQSLFLEETGPISTGSS